MNQQIATFKNHIKVIGLHKHVNKLFLNIRKSHCITENTMISVQYWLSNWYKKNYSDF